MIEEPMIEEPMIEEPMIEESVEEEPMEDFQPTVESDLPPEEDPPLEDVPAIIRLGELRWQVWSDNKDNKRLLVWLIAISKAKRGTVSTVSKGMSSTVITPDVWTALRSLKGHSLKIRGRSDEESSGLMQLGTWYTTWVSYNVPDEENGISLVDVNDALASSPEQFEEFYNFLLEQLLWHQTRSPKSQKHNSRDMSSLPYKKNHRQRSDSEDPLTASFRKQKSVRKVIHESQEGIDQRANAQARAEYRDIRSKELHRQLQAIGGSGNLGDRTIVNPATGENEDFITINPHISKQYV